MEAALANVDPVPLLTAVLPQALDRHPKVASRGVMYTAECLSRLHEGSVAGGGLVDGVDVKSVVAALAKGASSRDSDGKEAAWRGVTKRQAEPEIAEYERDERSTGRRVHGTRNVKCRRYTLALGTKKVKVVGTWRCREATRRDRSRNLF